MAQPPVHKGPSLLNILFPNYASGRSGTKNCIQDTPAPANPGDHSTLEPISHLVVPANSSFTTYFNTERYSDIIVTVGNEKIFAHRVILQRNEFFDRMMQNDMLESQTREIRLQDITLSNAKIFLQYLYGVPISEDLSFDDLTVLLKETHSYMERDFTNRLWAMIDAQRGKSIQTRVKALELETDYREAHAVSAEDFTLEVIAELSYPVVLSVVSCTRKSWLHWSTILKWIVTHPNSPQEYRELLALCSFENIDRIPPDQILNLLTYVDHHILHDTILSAIRKYFSTSTMTPPQPLRICIPTYQDIKLFNDQRCGEISFEENRTMDQNKSSHKRHMDDEGQEESKVPKLEKGTTEL